MCYAVGMGEKEIIRRTGETPISQGRLEEDLRSLGVEPGVCIIVHSSLSSCGWVCGGAHALVLALEEVVRPWGLLVMPTHSGHLSDPAGWQHPPVPEQWWEPIRETMPAYDPDLTPSRGVGVVPELFRKQADVVRSAHPQLSFAVWGEDAVEMAAGHEPDYSLGEGSPLAKIYKRDGYVLLIGAGYESNTSFHLAEYRASFPKKREIEAGAPVMIDGHRRWKLFRDIDINSDDFGEIGKAFEKRYGDEISIGKVGLATARLFRQRLCVDFAVHWLERHRI